ncbi:transcriptional regulator [Paractinoplanes deccanensis]|uniref:Transcriptional regulator n=2 Tax=Paractinoplanes deccanensis TaxID=113561 RepID=A0ABQ3Y942_9ACTN|nr:transcriptional regulator [Actinoplanes deccanensis]
MPSADAEQQYARTTDNLSARIAIHAYGTNPQGWFSWLGERLPDGGDVLEVGAGTGELWRHLDPRRAGLRLTLVDFSAAMCERLREVPGADVRQCDAAELPFAEGRFDAVIANHMLYHVDDPDAVLREFARVLRPGGRLFVATNGRGHMEELFAVATAVGKADVGGTPARSNFLAEEAPEYIGRHFRDVVSEAYPSSLEIPAAEPVVAYLASLSGEPLAPEQLAAARDLVQARIDADGHFRVHKHTELITATR